jgi:hypothetical protein
VQNRAPRARRYIFGGKWLWKGNRRNVSAQYFYSHLRFCAKVLGNCFQANCVRANVCINFYGRILVVRCLRTNARGQMVSGSCFRANVCMNLGAFGRNMCVYTQLFTIKCL